MLDQMPTTAIADKPSISSPAASVPRRARRRIKRWVWWTVAAVLVVSGIAAAVAWRQSSAARTAAAANVDIETVQMGTVRQAITSSGTVAANVDQDIKCRANGPISKLPVDKGSLVKAGDLLCQLDPEDEQLAVDVAQQNFDQATAKVEQAKLAYEMAKLNLETTRSKVNSALVAAQVKAANLQAEADRQKQLAEQKLGSTKDYENAQTDAATARDAAVAAQAAVDQLKQQELDLRSKALDITTAESFAKQQESNLNTAKRQLQYTTVLSPMDGVVTALGDKIAVGSQIQSGTGGFSGGTTILSLADRSHVYVLASVDQSDLAAVKEEGGQRALVTVDSYPGRVFEGVTRRRAPTGTNVSNVVTFEVKVEVTDKDKQLLWPAMTGTVTIIEAERANVLTMPTSAVIHRDGRTLVKLANGTERAVVVGLEGGDTSEVVSGLVAGDRVIAQPLELPSKWRSAEAGPGGPPPPK